MNIFVLDKNPVLAAQYQCDKHVVKMTLETAQLLCSPFQPGLAPYKRTHYNHPSAIWTRTSIVNYMWLIIHGLALSNEYTFRYGKVHACEEKIKWCNKNKDKLSLPNIGLTDWPQAMPDRYKSDDVVKSYRLYYLGDKYSFAKWQNNRNPPLWWKHSKKETENVT